MLGQTERLLVRIVCLQSLALLFFAAWPLFPHYSVRFPLASLFPLRFLSFSSFPPSLDARSILNGGLLEARFSCILQHIIQWPRCQVGSHQGRRSSRMFPRWRLQMRQRLRLMSLARYTWRLLISRYALSASST